MTERPWQILFGDCLAAMRAMPAASVDLVFMDPPFGHNNNNGDLIANRERALGRGNKAAPARPIKNDGPEANGLFKSALIEIRRLLRHGACCCCCCCGGGPDPQFARWSLWMDEVLSFKQMIVWDKGPMGLGWHYRRSTETVLVAQRNKGRCNWYDKTHRVENIIRPGWRGIKKIIPTAQQHPTQKPVELAALFIELHSKPGDLVLDPFCGSGTTGEAALRLGRRFIGIELDPHWARVARNRLRKVAC